MARTVDYPYGVRDAKLYPLTLPSTYATGVDVTAIRTVSIKPDVKSETLEGDDVYVATHAFELGGSWDIEAGGITLAAWKVMAGTAAQTDSGTTPSETAYIDVLSTSARGYFGIIGKAVSDGAGDVQMQVFKAMCTSGPEGAMQNGAFLLTKASGMYMPNSAGNSLRILLHELAVSVPSAWPATTVY